MLSAFIFTVVSKLENTFIVRLLILYYCHPMAINTTTTTYTTSTAPVTCTATTITTTKGINDNFNVHNTFQNSFTEQKLRISTFKRQ